jgi:hypothetical protein
MLIALMTILFLSGGGTAGLLYDLNDLKKQAKIVITEDASRSEALDIIKSLKKRTKEHNKLVKSTAKQLDAALDDEQVADADIDAIWGVYVQGVTAYHRDLVDARFELKEHISRDEWTELFAEPVETKD